MWRTLGTCALLAAAACRDIAPLEKDVEAVVVDAGAPADAAATSGADACRTCIRDHATGDTACGRAARTCLGDGRCSVVLECALSAGCTEVPTHQERVTCATPCFLENGLSSFEDPLYVNFIALDACFYDACDCFPR